MTIDEHRDNAGREDESQREIGLDPDEAHSPQPRPGETPGKDSGSPKREDVEVFAVEEPEEPSEPTRKVPAAEVPLEDVEHCPNCGAVMGDAGTLVCLRCGYDLKRLRVTRTTVGKPVEDDSAEHPEEAGPITRPGRGGLWLPLAMAAVSGLVLIIGHLAGTAGLYPDLAAAEPQTTNVPVGARLIASLQFLVLMVMWCGCGLVGVFLLAQTLQRTVGDLQLAAARVLGIVVTIRLVAFINIAGPRWLEWLAESVLQAAAFVALSIVLFALKPRDGLIMGGFALIALLVLWLFARAMVWSIEGGVQPAA